MYLPTVSFRVLPLYVLWEYFIRQWWMSAIFGHVTTFRMPGFPPRVEHQHKGNGRLVVVDVRTDRKVENTKKDIYKVIMDVNIIRV